MTQSLGEQRLGRLLHRSPELARRRAEDAARARTATIESFGCAATAPPIQLRAFDDAMVQLHEAIAVGNHEVWGDPLPAYIQMKRERNRAAHVQSVAAHGVRGTSAKLPHAARIQDAFGRHDISNVRAHLGAEATKANQSLGALGYTRGADIAFAKSPDLHLAAHEAAHVVQQRAGVALKGGVGQIGDVYERHADEVADAVVEGRSAEAILDRMAGMGGNAAVQCKEGDAPPDAERVQSLVEAEGERLRSEITEVKEDLAAAQSDDDKTRLAAREKELEDELVANDADLQTVQNPATDKAELDKLEARIADKTVAIDERQRTATESVTNGLQTSDKQTTTAVSGDATGTTTSERKESLDWHGYDVSEEQSKTFEQGDHATEESTKKSTHVGLDGVSQETSTSQKVGDHAISDSSSTALTRGDGKGGVSTSKTHSDGLVDDDGALVEGTETKRGANAEATLNGNEVGLGGGANAESTTVRKDGPKTGVSAHCGGNVSVQVLPADEGEGYKLVITMKLQGSVGASIGKDEKDKEGEANLSAGINASGGITKTFTRNLSADEVAPYLASLDNVQPGQAGSGAFQEFGVIATAWKAGWNAESIAAVLQEAGDDPEALKKMENGESNETVVQGGLSGEAGVKSKTDDFGGGVSVGGEANTTITNKFTDQGDATEMEAQVDDELGGKVGAEATIYKVNVGGEIGSKSMSGTGVTFSVPKDDPQYAEIVARLKAAKTQADIEQLKKDFPQVKSADTTMTGHEDSAAGHIGVGGVEVGVSSTHGQKHTEKVGEDGSRTDVYEGHANTGGAVKAGDYSYGSSEADSATMVVKDDQMSADLQTVKTESNLTDSVNNALDKKDESVAQQVLGGGEKPKVEEDTNTQGMFANDGDMNQLIGEAEDPAAWQKHCADGNREDWITLGKAIRAAKGDKKAVAAAIASFLDADASGRNEYLENVIRPAGSNAHGSSYEFPGHLAAEKATYKRLVDADPTSRIAAEKEKDKAKGIEAAKACLAELEKLEATLSSAQDEFQDSGRFGEMMRRIADRKSQVTKLMDLGEQATETARYNELLTNCQRYKYAEDKDFAEILANFDGDRGTDAVKNVELQNNLRALYLDWDPAYAELATLGEAHGFDRKIWSKYAPAKERMAKLDKGKPPTEKTSEELDAEATNEREAHEQNQAAYEGSDAHVQAEAQAQMNAKQAEKAKAVPLARQRVATAKTKAAEAAGWHNAAMKAGKDVGAEAQRLAGEGWTKWALVNDDQTFETACKADYADASAVSRVADKKVADYQAVQALFDEGKAARMPA